MVSSSRCLQPLRPRSSTRIFKHGKNLFLFFTKYVLFSWKIILCRKNFNCRNVYAAVFSPEKNSYTSNKNDVRLFLHEHHKRGWLSSNFNVKCALDSVPSFSVNEVVGDPAIVHRTTCPRHHLPLCFSSCRLYMLELSTLSITRSIPCIKGEWQPPVGWVQWLTGKPTNHNKVCLSRTVLFEADDMKGADLVLWWSVASKSRCRTRGHCKLETWCALSACLWS